MHDAGFSIAHGSGRVVDPGTTGAEEAAADRECGMDQAIGVSGASAGASQRLAVSFWVEAVAVVLFLVCWVGMWVWFTAQIFEEDD